MLRLLIQRNCAMVNVCCFSWEISSYKCRSSSSCLRFPYFCPSVPSARNVLPHSCLPSGLLQLLQKLAMSTLPETLLISQAFPLLSFWHLVPTLAALSSITHRLWDSGRRNCTSPSLPPALECLSQNIYIINICPSINIWKKNLQAMLLWTCQRLQTHPRQIPLSEQFK